LQYFYTQLKYAQKQNAGRSISRENRKKLKNFFLGQLLPDVNVFLIQKFYNLYVQNEIVSNFELHE